jgi:arginine decarboxylase
MSAAASASTTTARKTNFESSMNYTLEEYANDVVYHIQTVCDEAGIPHPTIISESGRAVVAYHSVLVFNVLGVSGFGSETVPATANPDWEQPLVDLVETHNNVNARKRPRGVSRCAAGARHGAEPVQRRLPAARPAQRRREPVLGDPHEAAEDHPDDGRGARRTCRILDEQLSDTYFCNFSLFQSIPDSWRSSSSSPVMPIHRLNEKPGNHAVLGDITCDSDGKLDRFVDRPRRQEDAAAPLGQRRFVLPRRLPGRRVPGDSRRPPQPVRRHARRARQPRRQRRSPLDELVKGDTVREVLDYVEFDAETLLGKLRTDVESAVREGRVDYEGAGRLLRFYEDGLHGYTYLES